jgi:hypothetical protein
MCRTADIAWNLDALGAAAEAGVDVFCRETLAGDWLETIGLWQPGPGNVPYTPHPDFWVAVLWRKLMGVRVLGALANSTVLLASGAQIDGGNVVPTLNGLDVESGEAGTRDAEPQGSTTDITVDGLLEDKWRVDYNQSCVYNAAGLNGSKIVPYYGITSTWKECEAKCDAAGAITDCARNAYSHPHSHPHSHQHSHPHSHTHTATPPHTHTHTHTLIRSYVRHAPGAACKAFAWAGAPVSGEWLNRCYGRIDGIYSSHPLKGVVSGCAAARGGCTAPPPAPAAVTSVRSFAHCSKETKGAVTFAVAGDEIMRVHYSCIHSHSLVVESLGQSV